MNKVLPILFFIFFGNLSFSQGLFNNGALIVIQSSALVHIDGDANGKYTNSTSGTHGRIDIDGVMEVEGNWTNNAGNDVFINNTDGDGWVKLNGAAASTQTIGGSHLTVFENLEINHNTQGATCGVNNNQVNAQLKLTNGPLVLNSNTFIVNNTATTGIARTNGYIVSETIDATPNTELSRLQWNIGTAAAGNTFTIPFGKVDASYIPFSATISSAGTGSGNLTAATYPTNNANTPYPAYPNTVTTMAGGTPIVSDNSANAVDRFWGITWNSYTSNPTATLLFTYAVSEINGLTATDLQAQYWDPALSPAGWSSNLLGTGTAYQVSGVSGINVSRDWVLVNKNQPLPVELIGFQAQCNNGNVLATWATASEFNNDYFTVEKSIDNTIWETVGTVSGAGTSNTVNTYSLFDYTPFASGYYRLSQTDFNGSITTFSPVIVSCNDDQNSNAFESISINHNQNGNIDITFTYPHEGDNFSCSVFDCRGRLIFNGSNTSVSGYNTISLSDKDFAFGIYLITLSSSDKIISQKFLLQ